MHIQTYRAHTGVDTFSNVYIYKPIGHIQGRYLLYHAQIDLLGTYRGSFCNMYIQTYRAYGGVDTYCNKHIQTYRVYTGVDTYFNMHIYT